MKHVLIIGTGGREHAIAKVLKRDNCKLSAIGPILNLGMIRICETVLQNELKQDYFDEILNIHKGRRIDFVFVGPEAPLSLGLVDFLKKHKILAIGPDRTFSQLETSKLFTRKLFQENLLNNYIPDFIGVNAGKKS